MKGLILLFLVISFGIIGWRSCDDESRKWAKGVVSKNLLAFISATAAVAVAIFVSTNTSLRLV